VYNAVFAVKLKIPYPQPGNLPDNKGRRGGRKKVQPVGDFKIVNMADGLRRLMQE